MKTIMQEEAKKTAGNEQEEVKFCSESHHPHDCLAVGACAARPYYIVHYSKLYIYVRAAERRTSRRIIMFDERSDSKLVLVLKQTR